MSRKQTMQQDGAPVANTAPGPKFLKQLDFAAALG